MNTENPIKPNVTLNLCGLSCPHPLLGAKKVLDEMNSGDVLLLVSDCPGTKADIFSWVNSTNNELLQTGRDATGASEYYLRKGKRAQIIAAITIDMCGAVCPGPIVEAKRVLEAMQAGEVLKLVSSCSAARDDVKTWTANTGHILLETSEIKPGVLAFYIRK